MSEECIVPVTSLTFTDPDELEAAFSHQQSFHVVQLDLQPLHCHLLNLHLDGAIFSFRQIQNPIRIFGEKRSDRLVFEFLIFSDTGTLVSHGYKISVNTLYGFDSSRGIDLVLPAKTVMASLSVERRLVQDCLEIMERADLDERFFATNYVQSPDRFSPVQQYLRELYKLVKQRSPFLNQPQIHKLLLDDYLPLLISSIPLANKTSTIDSHPLSRSRFVAEAEAYMMANLGKPLTLKDLCHALNASKSPMSQGFQEVFGISPMAYLKILRLNAIHKALKAADPQKVKIIDIAHRFGFWHAGRLSTEYKKMFGESPSETLKR